MQREYLHFSVILRPWVLVRPQESNPRPPALQSTRSTDWANTQNLNQFSGSVTEKQYFIGMLTDGNYVWDDVLFLAQNTVNKPPCFWDSPNLERFISVGLMCAIDVMFTSSFMQILKYLTLSKLNWHCCLYLAFSKNEWLSWYSDFIKWLQKVFVGSMYHQTLVCGGERGIILEPHTCQTSGEHTCTTQNDLGCKTFIIHASLYTLII